MSLDNEAKKERVLQRRRVMPLIGGLLDAWEGTPNDVKGYIWEQAPALAVNLEKMDDAMCADKSDAVKPR